MPHVSEEEQRNKQIARSFFEEVWNRGDESAIDRFIADDAIGNDPKFGVGRESFRLQWHQWRTGFPDVHFEVQEVIAEGNTVVTQWRLTGTHQGKFLGRQPTGRHVDVTGVSIDRIFKGMIVSGFDSWDALSFRQQLGMIPSD